MSVFAIGDIHGSYIALKTLLMKLTSKEKEHTYIFLGDYVNKGSESKKVIDKLIKFSKKHQCVFLRGNHDIIFMEARFAKENYKRLILSGGDKTLESYGAMSSNWEDCIPKEHWEFLESTIPYFKMGDKVFVHAGLEEGVSLKKQDSEFLFWKKNHHPIRYKKGITVYCGHNSQKSGLNRDFGHTLFLDTFAWGGGYLTALNVNSGKYFQANNSGELRKGKVLLKIDHY